MQSRRFHSQLITAVAATVLPIGSALACPYLTDGLNTLQGNSTSYTDDDFRVATSGTLTISIADVPTQTSFSDFGFALTTGNNSLIGQLNGAGDLSIPVTAGTIYFLTFGPYGGGGPQGELAMDVNYQPAGEPAPVPLPGSLLLTLSGLGLVGVGRLRAVNA